MAIASPGLGSGLDVNSIVTQLMALESRPVQVLAQREASFQAKLSAYGSLKGALSALQTAAKAISTSAGFSAKKATVADTDILSASATTSATAGAYDIEVQALAKAQNLKSGALSATGAVGSGTITIEFGSYRTVDADNIVFDLNADKSAKTITISAGTDKLTDIRDAINAANAGVTASIVGDGSNAHLFIASNDTGLANQLRISVDDADTNDTDAAGLSALVYDGTKTAGVSGTANLSQFTAASNATVIINGITLSKASNTISDAIEGVSLSLAAPSEAGVTTRLTVAADTNATKSAIENFVKAYNALNKTVADLTRFDTATKKASVLTGDSTARSVQSQLRGILGAAISGATGVSTLSDIGLSFQLDGSLAVDGAKLSAALTDPDKNVASLFISGAGVTGYAAKIDTVVTSMLASGGLIAGRTEGIDSSIKDIGKRRDALTVRLESIERRLRKQFTALDALVSSMNQTSNYLQQQLANLPKTNQGA